MTASLWWIFSAAGWTLAIAGAPLLLWSLFHDCARGRRRCPRCWYDMGGIPSLTCPECGRAARYERHLRKTRLHPFVAALSLLVVVAGYAITRVPLYLRGGWPRILPTTALIWLAPPQDSPADPLLFVGTRTSLRTLPNARERLREETWSRLLQGDMAQWQSQIFLSRVYTANPALLPEKSLRFAHPWNTGRFLPAALGPNLASYTVELRPPDGQWVAGMTPDSSHVVTTRWPGQQPGLMQDELLYWIDPPLTKDSTVPLEMRLRRGPQVVYVSRTSALFATPRAPQPPLAPINTPEATSRVLAALRPTLDDSRYSPRLVYDDTSGEAPWHDIDFLVSFVAEVRSQDRVIARGVSTLSRSRAHTLWRSVGTCPLAPVNGAEPEDWKPPLTLVIRGDTDLASLANSSFGPEYRATACWTGEIVVPIDSPPGRLSQ